MKQDFQVGDLAIVQESNRAENHGRIVLILFIDPVRDRGRTSARLAFDLGGTALPAAAPATRSGRLDCHLPA